MPLPVASFHACPLPIIGAQGIGIDLPGGARLSAISANLYQNEQEAVRLLLGYAHMALAPLKPLFDILAALLAAKKVLDAVPKVVSSPQKVISALLDAGSSFAQLAKILPQVSVPLFAGHLIDLVELALRGLIAELDLVITKERDIDRLETSLAGSVPGLAASIACARAINQKRLCAVDEALAPFNSLFVVLNLFLKLIGKANLPQIDSIAHDMQAGRTMLLAFIAALEEIRKTIPVPKLEIKARC